jgi:hypothetical protein
MRNNERVINEIERYAKESESQAFVSRIVTEAYIVFDDNNLSQSMQEVCMEVLNQLVHGWPLTPLLGTDDEWGWNEAKDLAQNKRYHWVFKNPDGKVWDTNSLWFQRPDGLRYLDASRFEGVVFPYTPTTRTISVDEFGDEIDNPDCIA